MEPMINHQVSKLVEKEELPEEAKDGSLPADFNGWHSHDQWACADFNGWHSHDQWACADFNGWHWADYKGWTVEHKSVSPRTRIDSLPPLDDSCSLHTSISPLQFVTALGAAFFGVPRSHIVSPPDLER